jgi:L-alanine-DL-glutamate epimerase-like enolase superfamily enzyme
MIGTSGSGTSVRDRRLRLREFALRLRSPLGTAHGEIDERRGVVVRLDATIEGGPDRTDAVDGDRTVRGVGEAAPLTPWTEEYGTCREALTDVRAALARDDEVDLDGLPAAARHAVSLGAADAAARDEGVPLAALLAERAAVDHEPTDGVPVNATVGDGSVAETVRGAESAVAEGFDCLKLKVGVRDLEADLDRLRAVRAAVGDRITLRADANGAWTRAEAGRAVDALGDPEVGLAYVEQPLPADDHAGHRALRERASSAGSGAGDGVGIALDESVNGASRWPHPIADYADVAVLKPMAQAGPVPTVALARHLRSRGVTPVVTTTVDAVVARTAAVHVAAAIPDVPPCGLATADLLAEDLAADPAPVEDGAVRVPDGPGLAGTAFDELVGDP